MTLSNRLTTLGIKSLKAGRHADGNGLYIHVKTVPSKSASEKPKTRPASWLYIYQWDGNRREMGLGSFKDLTLAEARIKASEARSLVVSGIDPLAARHRPKTAGITFREVATDFIASKGKAWRNEKHGKQWKATLELYAQPLMDMPVSAITVNDVLACLKDSL